MYRQVGYFGTDETTKLKPVGEEMRRINKEVVGERIYDTRSKLKINDNGSRNRHNRQGAAISSTSNSFSGAKISSDKLERRIDNSLDGKKTKGKPLLFKRNSPDVTDTRNNSQIHIASLAHKTRICSVCKRQIFSVNWESHVRGKEHRRNLRDSTEDVENLNYIYAMKDKLGSRNRFFQVDKTSEPISFKCILCETNLFSEKDIDRHLECKYHNMAVSKFFQAKRRAKRSQAYSNSVADDNEQINSLELLLSDSCLSTARNRSHDRTINSLRNSLNSNTNNNNDDDDNDNNGNSSLSAKYNGKTDDKVSPRLVEPHVEGTNCDGGTLKRTEVFKNFRGELTCSNCSGKIAFHADALAAHLKVCRTSAEVSDQHERKVSESLSVVSLSSLKKYLMSLVDSRLEQYVEQHNINVKRLMAFRGLFTYFARRFLQSENSYRVVKFVCEPCSFTVTDDSRRWISHISNQPDDHRVTFDHQVVGLFCYACVICSTYLYASNEYIRKHASKCQAAFPVFPELLCKRSFLANNARAMVPSPVSSKHSSDVIGGSCSEIIICCCTVCQLCTVNQAHFGSADHKTKQIMFCDLFFCETCNVVFYCDRETYNDHLFSVYHIRTNYYETLPGSSTVSRLLNECVNSINSASLHRVIFGRTNDAMWSLLAGDFFHHWQENVIYFCKPCNEIKHARLDWDSHLHEGDLHRCPPKLFEFAEYFCQSCSAVIFSTFYDYVGHCHSEEHRKFNDFISHNVNVIDRFGSAVADYLSKSGEESSVFVSTINKTAVAENSPINRQEVNDDGDNQLTDDDAGRRASVDATAAARGNKEIVAANVKRIIGNKRCGDEQVDTVEVRNTPDNDYENSNKIGNGGTENNLQKQLVIHGIPNKILFVEGKVMKILRRYGPIKRTYRTIRNPGALIVVAEERIYQRLQKNIHSLLNDFETHEIQLSFIEITPYIEPPKIETCLRIKVASIFSNAELLTSIVSKQILDAEYESKSSVLLTKIKDLQISLIRHAERIFDQEFIKSYVFGSRITGLASSQGDIDIFLDIGRSFRGMMGRLSSVYQKELVETFASIMNENSEEFGEIVSIASAKVPIVKFYHKPTKLLCDLSFKNGLGSLNSLLIRLYLNLDVRVKPIVNAVKLWADYSEIRHPFLLSTYVIIWMVLFFLMNLELPVVPSVAELREYLPDHLKNIKIDNWTCSFPKPCNVKWESKNKLKIEQLLHLFFVFYSDPKLNNYVLSPLSGSKIGKWHFSRGCDKQLPSEFDDYKNNAKMDRNISQEIRNPPKNLCIQDPFVLSRNLTKNFSNERFRRLNDLCKKTADVMKL